MLAFWYASGDGCLTKAASEHLSLYRSVGQHRWNTPGATRPAVCTFYKLNMYMARAAVAELRAWSAYEISPVIRWGLISRSEMACEYLGGGDDVALTRADVALTCTLPRRHCAR